MKSVNIVYMYIKAKKRKNQEEKKKKANGKKQITDKLEHMDHI